MKTTIVTICLILLVCGCAPRPPIPPRYDVYVEGELVVNLAARSQFNNGYSCEYTEPGGDITEVFGPHVAVKWNWNKGDGKWERSAQD